MAKVFRRIFVHRSNPAPLMEDIQAGCDIIVHLWDFESFSVYFLVDHKIRNMLKFQLVVLLEGLSQCKG